MAKPDYYPPSGWRTILAAKHDFEALERLITRYWFPIVQEMQSRAGCSRTDAEDLAQEFIQVWLRRNFLKNVDPKKGRFRSFIKKCIARFLIDTHRQKANQPELQSLEQATSLAGETFSPEEIIDLAWAKHLLGLVLAELERSYTEKNQLLLFRRLKPFLTLDLEGDSQTAAADELGFSRERLRVEVFRLRRRYGARLRREIMESVGRDEDWEAEYGYFRSLLTRNPSVTL